MICCSCSRVRIEDNTRIQITGTIISDGDVTDLPIRALASNYGNSGSESGNAGLLGKGRTNSNGNFDFPSLLASDRSVIIEVNNDFEEDRELSSAIFIDEEEDKKLYDLGEIELPKQIRFNLSVENTSGTTDTLIYKFTYEKSQKVYIRERDSYVEYDEGSNYISVYRQIPSDTIQEHHFYTRDNSTIQFIYNLGENAQQKIEIPVNPENTTYEFEY